MGRVRGRESTGGRQTGSRPNPGSPASWRPLLARLSLLGRVNGRACRRCPTRRPAASRQQRRRLLTGKGGSGRRPGPAVQPATRPATPGPLHLEAMTEAPRGPCLPLSHGSSEECGSPLLPLSLPSPPTGCALQCPQEVSLGGGRRGSAGGTTTLAILRADASRSAGSGSGSRPAGAGEPRSRASCPSGLSVQVTEGTNGWTGSVWSCWPCAAGLGC